MTEWSVERIRKYVMEEMYELYMQDSQSYIHFVAPQGEEASETAPSGLDAIREAKHLVYGMWAETRMAEEMSGRLSVRLTPLGRDAWEAYLKAKEKDPAAALSQPAI